MFQTFVFYEWVSYKHSSKNLLCTYAFKFLEYYWIIRYCVFNYIRNRNTFLILLYYFTLHLHYLRSSVFHILLNSFNCQTFLLLTILVDVKQHLVLVLIYISIITNNAKHCMKCSSAFYNLHELFIHKCFPHFLNWVTVLL